VNTFVLLPAAHFKDAINGGHVADAATHEILLSISMGSREEVDELVDRALAAGGKQTQEPVDMPEIYGRTFADLDGHLWNIFYMSA
jgi:predicted lactoylglutathione lyase